MKDIQLGKYRKARIWLDELPPMPIGTFENMQCSFSSKNGVGLGLRKAAVELYVPSGVYEYGLLGAEMYYSGNPGLDVELITSEGIGVPYQDSLVGVARDAYWGLPQEYVQAVLKGVSLALSEPALQISGKLTINTTSFSVIGSSELAFTWVARVLIRLFGRASLASRDEFIAQLFEFEL